MRVQPIIIAGGSGTRLWPLSRSGFPKQFLAFNSPKTLFQQACDRCNTISHITGSPLIVTNEEHRFIALEQLREMGFDDAALLLEPMGRNTAPAMTLAALQAMDVGDDPVLFVMPADQSIQDEMAFQQAAEAAVTLADKGSLVVLGVVPRVLHTGYGYIQADGDSVLRFEEKPSADKAEKYLQEGNYFWNAGIFVTRASLWLELINHFRPDIASTTLEAWNGRSVDHQFIRPDADTFRSIPSESIDYAVIEKLPDSPFDIKVVPLAAGWDDLGSWDAVWQTSSPDENGNFVSGDVVSVDAKNTYVNASSRMVGLVGVDNLVVVETADAVLVADKHRSQEVKAIVEKLTSDSRVESDLHREVLRPWGSYDSLDQGERFKVKRIVVNPGASLSRQKHYHRAEHWVVVKGTAEVTCGDKVFLLTENQSTYIPLGEVHRLSNPGKKPLEIIEVQSGCYLGEDDIERFEDNYGR